MPSAKLKVAGIDLVPIGAAEGAKPVPDPLDRLAAAAALGPRTSPTTPRSATATPSAKASSAAAVTEGGCATPREVMARTRAGTGCGSCRTSVIAIVGAATGGLKDELTYLCPCECQTRKELAGLTLAVDDFYRRLWADDELKGYFNGIDKDALKRHQRMFLTQALGGGNGIYDGQPLPQAHTGLNIGDDAFDRRSGGEAPAGLLDRRQRSLGLGERARAQVDARGLGGDGDLVAGGRVSPLACLLRGLDADG
ncbi:MAG: (2Fe-2S)-binding protein [Actinomycetota bacterium]|nr:(2Fe-2S)-binding protein [Actinomycetota bacterium]